MTWVYAHRGASADFAEHTPAAFQRALDLGADGVECDVRLSADGVVVLAHDATMKRTSGNPMRVSKATLDELRTLDVGAWQPNTTTDPDRTITDRQRRSVMTLHELVELLAAQSRPVGLFIETKHPASNGRWLEPCVARVLAEFGWNKPRPPDEPPISVMSFSAAALRRMQDADRQVLRTLLVRPPMKVQRRVRDVALVQGIGPSVSMLQRDAAAIRASNEAGLLTCCWTVDRAADLDRAQHLGLTAVITNRPGWALQRLGR